MKSKFLFVFAIAFGFLLFNLTSSKVNAGSCTYTGTAGGDWSDGANWTGTCVGTGGAPDTNDDITIPANTNTNNDISSLTLNSITFTGSPSSTHTGNEVTIIDSITNSGPPNPVTISFDIVLGGNVSLSTNNYSGTIDLNGNDIIAVPTVSPWSVGDITGNGNIIMADSGRVILSGSGTGYSGTLDASGNTVLGVFGPGMDGSDVVLSNGATFYGDGSSVNSLITDGTAFITPFNDLTDSPRAMGIGNGGIDLNPGDTVSIVINSAALNEADMVFTSGDFDLDSATLSITLNYVPAYGDSFVIADAVGNLTGIFDGLPDGSLISIGSSVFEINYSANSVTLTSIATTLFNPGFSANPATPIPGQSVVITSTWTSNNGGPVPTGTAELFNGTTSLGTVALVGGVATFNITAGFAAGTHSLTVQYNGDSTFGAATSNPLVLTVGESLADTGIQIPATFTFTILLLSLSVFLIYKKYEK